MFLRFVSSEIDRESGVSAGIFSAAYRLDDSHWLSDYDRESLTELLDWFDARLECPDRFSRPTRPGGKTGVCWFKPNANQHLAKAHEMATILEEYGFFTRMLKARRVGFVIYEDEFQVVAVRSREFNY